MPLNDLEFARRSNQAVEYRPDAMRLSWTWSSLPSVDAHTLNARFGCSIQIADTPADRKMFAEVFLASRSSVTLEVIIEHFSPAMRTELAALASQVKANDAVSGRINPQWIAALTAAAKPVAFACGLEFLPPFQLDIESPTLQRERLEGIARARADERTAGQVQHLQHAGELLKQFQALRQAAPDLSPGKLLEQLNPADRGLTLQTLMLASANEKASSPLWAVAGPYLAEIDPRQIPPRPKLIELPKELGPLRSVQPATVEGVAALLVGARSGVIVLPPGQADQARLYSLSGVESQLGFNRVIVVKDELWASHSEAGIVRWKISDPAAPPRIVQQHGVKNLQILLDGSQRVLCSAGNEIILFDDDSRTSIPTHSTSDVIALLPTSQTIVAVHQDGTLVVIERMGAQVMEVLHRGRPISAAAVMPWLGDVRLLLATEQGPVDCIGLDDPLLSEYLSPYRGLKILTTCADLIAAVSPDRQRIVVWNSWDGQRPIGEIHLSAIAKHRVADVDFAASR